MRGLDGVPARDDAAAAYAAPLPGAYTCLYCAWGGEGACVGEWVCMSMCVCKSQKAIEVRVSGCV